MSNRILQALVAGSCVIAFYGCGNAPSGETVMNGLRQRLQDRADLDCSSYTLVEDHAKGDNTHRWIIRASCRAVMPGQTFPPSTRYFRVSYTRMPGGWRYSDTAELRAYDPEAGPPRAVELPRGEESLDGWAMVASMALPVLMAALVFVLAVVLLRRRGEPVRYTGSKAFRVERQQQRPGQTKSHWTINPLDDDDGSG